MRFSLVFVGRTKEGFIKEGLMHYLKRIKALAGLEVVELGEEKGPDVKKNLRQEGRRILKRAGAGFVLLDESGEQKSSEEFARMLERASGWSFVLGGPYGVSDEVRSAAARRLSLSRMTLPHELARLVFAEQLYRALTITKGTGYHHS